MSNDADNYMKSAGGMHDPTSGGFAGELGRQQFERTQKQEQARLHKLGKDADSVRSSTGNGSMKGLVQFALVLVAIEAYLNFTGYLVSDFQRIAAFIGAVSSFGVVQVYWDLIVKIVVGLIVITVGGSIGYDALMGN